MHTCMRGYHYHYCADKLKTGCQAQGEYEPRQRLVSNLLLSRIELADTVGYRYPCKERGG